MASVPAAKGKQMVGPGAGRRNPRNNLPTRLNIPSNSLTPTSSAPSSLSPLIVPSNSSSGSSATQQQRVTNELINAMGRITPQPQEDDKDFFNDESVIKVSAPDGEEINPACLEEMYRLGEGAGGTVTK